MNMKAVEMKCPVCGRINTPSDVVKPLSTNDDMLFIQTAYLSPLEDMADYLRLSA